MPLRDHFHALLAPSRSWESLHALWSSEIVAHLNRTILPEGYYAETQVHIGSRVEVDVATMEGVADASPPRNGPTATPAAQTWAPPVPPVVLESVFPDEIEVEIFQTRAGASLVAAIELVSPGNKDRSQARRAFAAKCSSYLQLGIGLMIVDVVTERLANLHDELMQLLEQPEASFATQTALYAVSYRPVRRATGDRLECWPTPLAIGHVLPVLPLALRAGPTLPLDLEATYLEACRRSRL